MEFFENLANRLRLIVGRCFVTGTDYKNGELSADAELLAGEKRRGLGFSQQFGFSSRPRGNVSGVALFVGGSRENGVIIATDGDDFAEKLEEGEVLVHSPYGQRIHLKKDGSIEISAADGCLVKVTSELVCDYEITANAKIPAAAVKLSTHVHPSAVGPTSAPTPGT